MMEEFASSVFDATLDVFFGLGLNKFRERSRKEVSGQFPLAVFLTLDI